MKLYTMKHLNFQKKKFEIINREDIITLYTDLFSFNNVEIYTILCNDINLSKTRSYRFLPLIDEDTNIVISREADGIVTYNDCYNINLFSQSKKFLYMNYGQFSENYRCVKKKDLLMPSLIKEYKYDSYSSWLTIYINEINPIYFENKNKICDIYAGAVAFKLKLNNEYLLERKKELNRYINLFEFIDEQKYKTLNIGFDEILLLDLFKSFTTYNNNDIQLKLKLINSSIYMNLT